MGYCLELVSSVDGPSTADRFSAFRRITASLLPSVGHAYLTCSVDSDTKRCTSRPRPIFECRNRPRCNLFATAPARRCSLQGPRCIRGPIVALAVPPTRWGWLRAEEKGERRQAQTTPARGKRRAQRAALSVGDLRGKSQNQRLPMCQHLTNTLSIHHTAIPSVRHITVETGMRYEQVSLDQAPCVAGVVSFGIPG